MPAHLRRSPSAKPLLPPGAEPWSPPKENTPWWPWTIILCASFVMIAGTVYYTKSQVDRHKQHIADFIETNKAAMAKYRSDIDANSSWSTLGPQYVALNDRMDELESQIDAAELHNDRQDTAIGLVFSKIARVEVWKQYLEKQARADDPFPRIKQRIANLDRFRDEREKLKPVDIHGGFEPAGLDEDLE